MAREQWDVTLRGLFFFFVGEFGVQPAKLTPLKSWDLAPALKTKGGGGVLLKRCISQEVEIADPLSAVPSVTYFFLAVQAFEGDIEV